MAKKLPKKIAGVKLSKSVRKRGGKAVAMLNHPLVADIVAAGLIAAAAALRDNPKVKSAAKSAKKTAGNAASEIGHGAASLGTLVAAKAKEGADWMSESYAGMGKGSNGTGSKSGGKSAKSSKSSKSSGKSKAAKKSKKS